MSSSISQNGQGSPVTVLVHGFASSFEHNWVSSGWTDVLADANRDVVSIDLPAHGSGVHSHDPREYKDFEEPAWRELKLVEPVDAVGFSLGGLTLLRLASADSSRFRRLVIIGVGDHSLGLADTTTPSTASTPREPSRPDLLAIIEGQGDPNDPNTAVFRRLVLAGRNDPAALAAFLCRPQRPLIIDDLHRIMSPTLFIVGDRDFVGPATKIAAAVRNSKVLKLPGVDHFATPQSIRGIGAALDFLAE